MKLPIWVLGFLCVSLCCRLSFLGGPAVKNFEKIKFFSSAVQKVKERQLSNAAKSAACRVTIVSQRSVVRRVVLLTYILFHAGSATE